MKRKNKSQFFLGKFKKRENKMLRIQSILTLKRCNKIRMNSRENNFNKTCEMLTNVKQERLLLYQKKPKDYKYKFFRILVSSSNF